MKQGKTDFTQPLKHKTCNLFGTLYEALSEIVFAN